MSSVSGWEAKVKYSNRVVLEDVGVGDNADTTWEADYPVVDELGDITDDEGKIEVFLDGVLQATTLYTLDGDGGAAGVGLITFNSAPGISVVIEFSYYAYQTIGLIQSVSIEVNNNVQGVYGFGGGDRGPAELKEGKKEISLSLEKCIIGLDLIDTVAHEIDAARGWLDAHLFDLELYPKGDTVGDPLVTVRGKFSNYKLDLPHDSIGMETANMIGKTIETTLVS